MDLATFQGIGQGLHQGVSQGLNVGMRLREQESLDRHRQVLEEQTKAHTAVTNMQLEERRKMQEDYDRIKDIKTTPAFLSMPEEEQKKILTFMNTNKYTDENGIGKNGDIFKGWATLASEQKLYDEVLLQPILKQKAGKALEAWNALQEAKATGDPKKIQTAQALYNQANTALQSATDGGYKHLTMLQEHDLRMKEQESKKKNVIVSGGSSFDADTGQPIYLKPEKGSGTESQSDKSTDKALKRIDGVIQGYDSQITIFEKRLAAAEKAEDEKEITKWTNAINDHQNQKSIAINTKNQVLNGTLAPDAIVWGGNKSTTYKTADDVKAAFKSGKIKEAEAVKILKDKFGMK